MSLRYLIRSPETNIEDVADYLDALPHHHRLWETRKLKIFDQARLFRKAGHGPAVSVEHFVPAAVPDVTEVIHHGTNTFPMLTTFQKRFARPEGESARLFGYNEGITKSVLGPGCFVVHGTAGNPPWANRGALVVDYYLVPDGPVPPGWPRVISNKQGLQKFVYAGTRDFMRRVSRHVSVGRAFKGEKALHAYFVLCREDH
jgi:hypothetical protein